ncbi:MAG: leucyl aminopeptidase [Candidatus Latescibacteria bacterium]|nr:leucyl aminopeptidase [Candidatus Latescibacterota bacterium]
MNIDVKVGRIGGRSGDTVVIGVFQDRPLEAKDAAGIDEKLRKYVSGILGYGDFSGKEQTTSLLYPDGEASPSRVILVGLGNPESFTLETARQAGSLAAKTAVDCSISEISTLVHGPGDSDASVEDCAQATVEGALLGTYHHTAFKSDENEAIGTLDRMTIYSGSKAAVGNVRAGATTGQIVSQGAIMARDLSNAPGNALPPRLLADAARKMAKSAGLSCEVLNKKDIEALKMGALLAVSQGSDEPPRFIIMERGTASKKRDTLVLVGKGITFDSGGISIKPSGSMEDMKHDMSGAAAVIGAMQAIGKLKPTLHVVGIVPASENLPDGKAMKPGDVITAMSGKTIEVINTDAEGRLVLADALAYSARYKPAAVIDLATLTGACVIALGDAASGMMGNDEKLLQRVKMAGEKSGERVWHLPIWKEHHDQIKGRTGDIKNSGGRSAGALTAGAFLENFVDFPWVHLDIAGTAYSDKLSPYGPAGATGEGARLLVQFVRDWDRDHK